MVHRHPSRTERRACGTVQGIADDQGCGSIQNLGITPDHRGSGAWDSSAAEGPGRVSSIGPATTPCCIGSDSTKHRCDPVCIDDSVSAEVKTVYKAVEVAYS